MLAMYMSSLSIIQKSETKKLRNFKQILQYHTIVVDYLEFEFFWPNPNASPIQ
jgi:hypothetical protein